MLATIGAFLLLIAPWVGPFKEDTQAFITIVTTSADVSAEALFQSRVYVFGTLALVAISLFGIFLTLVRTITAPSKSKTVEISRLDGGTITLASDAIISQLRNVVAGEGSCEVAKVHVTSRGKSRFRLNVTLRPIYPEDVDELGARLHKLIQTELSDFTGGALDRVSLHFLRARNNAEELGEASVQAQSRADGIYLMPSSHTRPESDQAEAQLESGEHNDASVASEEHGDEAPALAQDEHELLPTSDSNDEEAPSDQPQTQESEASDDMSEQDAPSSEGGDE